MKQDGFTLLEVMVALVILAVASAGVIGAVSQSVRQTEALDMKSLAGWMAENRMAEIRAAQSWPDPGVTQDKVAMAQREWRVRVEIADTALADMRKVEIGVYGSVSKDAAPVASLTGFIGRH